jgi:hypothetical protein
VKVDTALVGVVWKQANTNAYLDLPFNLATTNVVHMTIKPADLMEDEVEAAGKHGTKGSIRAHAAGEEGGAGCRCVIL